MKDKSDPEVVIQHQPQNQPGGTFHPKGTVIQMPNGIKYRLGDNGWELIRDETDLEPEY